MKFAFIFLGIAAGMLTWWHKRPTPHARRRSHGQRLQRLGHSLLAGIVVYFSLMAVAMAWLLLTT